MREFECVLGTRQRTPLYGLEIRNVPDQRYHILLYLSVVCTIVNNNREHYRVIQIPYHPCSLTQKIVQPTFD